MKNIDSIIANAQKLMINEDFWSKVESVDSSRTTNGGKVKGSCAEVFRNNSDVQQMQMETINRRKKTGNQSNSSICQRKLARYGTNLK